jgi:hypothetical protein
MGWAQDMFGKWLIDGHVDSVFRASPPFEDVAVSSYLSGSSCRLTTPGASIMLSPEQSPFRGNCHSSLHKSRRHHKSCPHSPELTSPTPSQASGRHRNSHLRPLLPTPLLSVMVLKLTEGPACKRSWRPFCIQDGVASVSSNGKTPSRAASPEPVPIIPRGPKQSVVETDVNSDDGIRRRYRRA